MKTIETLVDDLLIDTIINEKEIILKKHEIKHFKLILISLAEKNLKYLDLNQDSIVFFTNLINKYIAKYFERKRKKFKEHQKNLYLIKQHQEGTMLCSLPGHMREMSPTYNQIIAKGKDIVPDILNYLRNEKNTGMSIMLLLDDILKISPYKPDKVGENTGFFAFDVNTAKKAWIDWGIENNLIEPGVWGEVEEIDGPYCNECGEYENLKYNEQYANGEYWTCKTCDNNFFYDRKKEE